MDCDCMLLSDYIKLSNEEKLETLYLVNADGIDYVLKSWREGLLALRRHYTKKIPFCDNFDDLMTCFRYNPPKGVAYMLYIGDFDTYKYLDDRLYLFFRLSDNSLSFVGSDDGYYRHKYKELKELRL